MEEVALVPPHTASPEAAVAFLVGHLVRAGAVRPEDRAEVTHSVLSRESLGSTAVGRGLAVPHTTTPRVAAAVGVAGRCAAPVPWPGAADRVPVRRVCLVLAPTWEAARPLIEAAPHRHAGPDPDG
jgi:PTS system fructose-specific IIA component/PTS system nitrogen regulatory IIA component